MPVAWAEDRATLGSDPSADSGAETEAGCRRYPVWFFELRTWHKAINPIKRSPRSLALTVVGHLSFRSPAAWSAFQDMSVMEKSVEHGGDGRGVAQEFAPIFDRSVRRQQGAGAFVAAHDDFQQVFGG